MAAEQRANLPQRPLVLLAAGPPPEIDFDGQEDFERSYITGHRWWTLDELRAATDDVFPANLADLIDKLLRNDITDRPIRLRS